MHYPFPPHRPLIIALNIYISKYLFKEILDFAINCLKILLACIY